MASSRLGQVSEMLPVGLVSALVRNFQGKECVIRLHVGGLVQRR
jgi:hypothetical protein